MSTESFADLGVSRAVVDCLSTAGITEPFAIQRAVIGDAIAGRDVIAKSPTGSGKTLAFGIPLVERIGATDPRPAALVLAPTRELATQIVDDIRRIAHARALRVTAVYGGAGLVKQAKDAAASHILVATPGRLEDLLARGAFRLDRIQMLVLDEADRMLDMGFRPAIDRIVAACPENRQTLFFSATLDGEAGRLAERYARDSVTHQHGPRERRSNEDTASRHSSASSAATVTSPSCSYVPSTEPTGWSSDSRRGESRLSRCTATSHSANVSRHSAVSKREWSTRSSPPMWRPAGSTSSGSRT
jgi:ATP-dependent RNA helicase RhlE